MTQQTRRTKPTAENAAASAESLAQAIAAAEATTEKKRALTNAAKQARFTAKKTADGFKRMTVWIKTEDFENGFTDQREGARPFPPKNSDVLSWLCGYAAARRLPPPQLADLVQVIDGVTYLKDPQP